MRRDCPQRQGSQSHGTPKSQSSVGHTQTQYVPSYQHGPREQISVPGCDMGTGCFADRPERPEHGSRSRAGTIGRDFGDPGACLHHYTTDGAHRSVSYIGYVPTLAPMGKSIV